MDKLKIDIDKKSCTHCEHCGAQLSPTKTLDYICRLNPGIPVAAFVPGASGLEVKVATAWPPVNANDWCGKFSRKLQS